ncbi:hypothetical protein BDR22DRAFT_887741 [Usnea florida]
MHFSLSTALLLLFNLLAYTTAQNPCTIVQPSAAFQIYANQPDLSGDLSYPSSRASASTLSTSTQGSSSTSSLSSTSGSSSRSSSPSSGGSSLSSSSLSSSSGSSSSSSSSPSTSSSSASSVLSSILSSSTVGSISTSSPSSSTLGSTSTSSPSSTLSTLTATSTPTSGMRQTRRSAHIPFQFRVSLDANGANAQDLVVAFTNLTCTGPGPFSFEFNFVPQSSYFTTGQGQINMYRVNTATLGTTAPTYNSIAPLTGSLIGTFELPSPGTGAGPVLLYLNQLVCQSAIVLRFGIARDSGAAGSVAYLNAGGMGLRERSGC